MKIESLHPGVDIEKVQAETGFELIVPAEIGRTEPPTAEELRILREEVDPGRLVIGRA
jgi:glutaconate CoA-transferase subunit B